ncbi:hypothetical protein M1446_05685 [Candidatus Dependentiae bacterium]|nr:hypothetical protein [Candidatus Dependentiae bacterium]
MNILNLFFSILISSLTICLAIAEQKNIQIINNTNQILHIDHSIPEYTRANINIELTKLNTSSAQEKLYKGILFDSKEEITNAIQAGADLNLEVDGKSPLLFAVLLKKSKAIEVLLECNARSKNILSLIEHAINLGDIRSAVLIEKKYGISDASYFGYNLLQHAIMKEDLESALLLVKNGANFSGSVRFGHDNIGLIEAIIPYTSYNTNNKSTLALELIQEIINRGYDVNNIWSSFDSNGIMHPCFYCHYLALELFIKNGANVNQIITTKNGSWTPLIYCVYRGDKKAVTILVDSGADINFKANPILNHSNFKISAPQTPLSMAIARGWNEIVELLMLRGASL